MSDEKKIVSENKHKTYGMNIRKIVEIKFGKILALMPS